MSPELAGGFFTTSATWECVMITAGSESVKKKWLPTLLGYIFHFLTYSPLFFLFHSLLHGRSFLVKKKKKHWLCCLEWVVLLLKGFDNGMEHVFLLQVFISEGTSDCKATVSGMEDAMDLLFCSPHEAWRGDRRVWKAGEKGRKRGRRWGQERTS